MVPFAPLDSPELPTGATTAVPAMAAAGCFAAVAVVVVVVVVGTTATADAPPAADTDAGVGVAPLAGGCVVVLLELGWTDESRGGGADWSHHQEDP